MRRSARQDVLDRVTATHAQPLASLMAFNFQEFDDVSFLTARSVAPAVRCICAGCAGRMRAPSEASGCARTGRGPGPDEQGVRESNT